MTQSSGDERPIVVFDVGGVLVHLDGIDWFRRHANLEPDEMRARWLALDVVQRFERGHLGFDEFAEGVLKAFEISISADAFRSEFATWARRSFPNARDIVRRVSQRHVTACLCNTNEVHWPVVNERIGVAGWFDHVFASHEIEQVKPDLESFAHVTDSLGTAPHRMVFLDDSQGNVDAARSAGWNAHLVQGTEMLNEKLVELQVI